MDRRTKRQKLQAMANQSVSPHEAEIAKAKLEELKEDPPQNTTRVFVNGVEVTNNSDSVSFSFQFDPLNGAMYYDFQQERWVFFNGDIRPSGV